MAVKCVPSVDEFAEILQEEKRWFQLGIFLGASEKDLDAISDLKSQSTCDILMLLIKLYHCLEKKSKSLSWESIAKALRRIGNHSLAEKIHSQYIKSSIVQEHSIAANEVTAHSLIPLSASTTNTEINTRSISQHDTSEDTSSTIDTAHVNAPVQEVHSDQPTTVVELQSSNEPHPLTDQEHQPVCLIANEYKNLSTRFENIVVKVKQAVRRDNVDLEDLQHVVIRQCDTSPLPQEIATVNAAFTKVVQSCSILNFQALICIVQTLLNDGESFLEQLTALEQSVESFKSSANMVELVTLIKSKQTAPNGGQKRVELKLREFWSKVTYKQFESFVNEIFQTLYDIMTNITVTKGCICLNWIIPNVDTTKLVPVLPLELIRLIGVIYLHIGDSIIYNVEGDGCESIEAAMLQAIELKNARAIELLLALGCSPQVATYTDSNTVSNIVNIRAIEKEEGSSGSSVGVDYVCILGHNKHVEAIINPNSEPDCSSCIMKQKINEQLHQEIVMLRNTAKIHMQKIQELASENALLKSKGVKEKRKMKVERIADSFHKFVDSSISERIQMKRGVWRLFNSAMENKWNELEAEMLETGLQILSKPTSSAFEPLLVIKGEETVVAKMSEKLMELQKSVCELEFTINRPGIVQHFYKDPHGQVSLTGIESKAKVCIELEIQKGYVESNPTAKGTGSFKKVCTASTHGTGVIVNLYVGDITEFNKAEVIVNAASEDLSHGLGVAGAIVDKGGPIIWQDCQEYNRKRGKVPVGSAVIFRQVGNLPPPYQAIVHAVGPSWYDSSSKEKSIALLRKAVKSSLKRAQGFTSIAIPAISSGLSGFPVDIAANALVEGVIEFIEGTSTNSNLNEINFVIFDDKVLAFKQAFKKHFHNVHMFDEAQSSAATSQNVTLIKNPSSSKMGLRTRGKGVTPKAEGTFSIGIGSSSTNAVKRSKHSLLKCIKIVRGDILKHQCEVIVNETDQQLKFEEYSGCDLIKAAGSGLQEECRMVPKPVQYGNIVTTKAYQLDSKHIVHVVLPGYSTKTQSVTVLRGVVNTCLQECTRLNAKSVSIPSLGAGSQEYPSDVVAKCLLEEAFQYLSDNDGQTSLQLINFVIFNTQVYQAFQHRYWYFQMLFSNNTAPASCGFSLVNTTNPELKLVGGGVSGALYRKGGPGLQDVCNQVMRSNPSVAEGEVIETKCEGIGQLQCKSVFHVLFEGREQGKLVKIFLACLERAEEIGYTSIAIPAIGTGIVGYSSALGAEGMVSAMTQFTRHVSSPIHLKKIRIVIMMPNVFKEFFEAFTNNFEIIEEISTQEMNIESSTQHHAITDEIAAIPPSNEAIVMGHQSDTSASIGSPTLTHTDQTVGHQDVDLHPHASVSEESGQDDLKHIATPLDKDALPSISFDAELSMCIYGENEESVKRAEEMLRGIIDTLVIYEEVDDVNILELPSTALNDLEKFAHQCNVDIDIDNDPALHTIKLHGCQSDVLKVKDKVRDALTHAHQLKVKKEVASIVSKHFKWVRQLSDGQEYYDEIFSFEIEQAFQQRKSSYCYNGEGDRFSINFSTMEETDLDNGEKVKVHRVDFAEVHEKPFEWAPMPKDSDNREVAVHLVKLTPSDIEYQDTLSRFDATMESRYKCIVSIQRIQNPVLYGQYMHRKKEMEKSNPPGCQNERWLFHGTKPQVIDAINTQGLNRSFRNVSAFGQGVYFMRDASYSHGYAPADVNNHRFMYLARVLTGEFVLGNPTMIVPPPKNQQNQHILFDSTVNDVANPSIFAVYTDSQAYTAYLITYT